MLEMFLRYSGLALSVTADYNGAKASIPGLKIKNAEGTPYAVGNTVEAAIEKLRRKLFGQVVQFETDGEKKELIFS